MAIKGADYSNSEYGERKVQVSPSIQDETNREILSGKVMVAGSVSVGRRSMCGKFGKAQGNQCGCGWIAGR